MAFTNAFLGLNHSMAHKLGGEYHTAHGMANAILLPYVIEYNAGKPTKFTAWPKYRKFIADQKYAKLAKMMGFPAATVQEGVQSLIQEVRKLNADLELPGSIRECGVDETEFFAKLPAMADRALEDQCTTANPRYPLVREIEEIYTKAYFGK